MRDSGRVGGAPRSVRPHLETEEPWWYRCLMKKGGPAEWRVA